VGQASRWIGDQHSVPIRRQCCQITGRQQRAGKTEPVVIHHGREKQAHRTRPAQPRHTPTGPRSSCLERRCRLPLGQTRRNSTSRPLRARRSWSRNQATVALLAGSADFNRWIDPTRTRQASAKPHPSACSNPDRPGFEQPEVAPTLWSAQRTRPKQRGSSEARSASASGRCWAAFCSRNYRRI
jgi:hypothetical protein